jgi:2-dehydro-3-deoxygalactonokinase
MVCRGDGEVGLDGVEWVAVDWGTTNVRAWGIAPDGSVVFSRSSAQGMSRLAPDGYPAALTALVGNVGSEPMDVLICGMAGARQGWREAVYLDAPADLSALATAAVVPPMPESPLRPRIVPGACLRQPGREDVMRGEETQLLGLACLLPGFHGTVVMPGTHSKWAELDGTRLARFETAMTGELFDVLTTHSVLRLTATAGDDAHQRSAGFDAGLDVGLDAPQRLTNLMFRARSASLLSGASPDWCSGYLSGLLIGAEIGGRRDRFDGNAIPVVGSAAVSALYARGFARLGVPARVVDAADATIAGLKAIREFGHG